MAFIYKLYKNKENSTRMSKTTLIISLDSDASAKQPPKNLVLIAFGRRLHVALPTDRRHLSPTNRRHLSPTDRRHLSYLSFDDRTDIFTKGK